MKLITALAAITLIAAPAQAGLTDQQNCVKTWNQLKSLGMDPSKSMRPCHTLNSYQNPAQRINAAGGRTALIRKCEGIWKPQLKDQGSYRYDNASIAVAGKGLKVTVKYTAKNSFNARVPGTFACNFGG